MRAFTTLEQIYLAELPSLINGLAMNLLSNEDGAYAESNPAADQQPGHLKVICIPNLLLALTLLQIQGFA